MTNSKTNEKSVRRTRQQSLKWRAALLSGAVVCGTISGTERTAHAALPAVTVAAAIEFIQKAYGVYSTVKSLLGGSGPDLAAMIRSLQEAVIGELRTQRNMALQSSTRSVFNLFTNLADNSPSDPTNASLWSNIITLQQTTADQMFDIIHYANDADSSYQLAPAYNALIATGTGVLTLKGEIWSDHPSSWNDFFIWLQPGMAGNYALVRSQRHQCYPGQNPGYLPPPNILLNLSGYLRWLQKTTLGKYRDSQLWKKLTNTNVKVATYSYVASGCRVTFSGTVNTTCNPSKKTCTTPVITCNPVFMKTWSGCDESLPPLACAESLVKPTFDADGTVSVIRAGMKGINKLSGGNDFEAGSNDPLVAQGKLVDPWVDEPSCGSGGPWAYAQLP